MILNRIEKQVDRIIAGLKVNEALKNVRFIREYGSDEAPSPVNGMIAVVSVRDMSTEKSYIGGYLSPSIKGESYNAGVEIRVYAPATENGSGLSEVVLLQITTSLLTVSLKEPQLPVPQVFQKSLQRRQR